MGALADGDGVVGGVFVDDVDGVAERDADASALADGEAVLAFVCADGVAFGVADVAGGGEFGASAFDEAGVVVVWDEADFL